MHALDLDPTVDASEAASSPLRRLAVTWRHPRTRVYIAVGMLEQSPAGFCFDYLESARDALGPRRLLGFPEFGRQYRSAHLFPLFAERLMDPTRPDRPRLLEALSLDALATPMEVLARSGGRRPGDTIELLPEPNVAETGETDCLFLVHGIRYAEGAEAAIGQLRRGQELQLVEDPSNPVNPLAVRVTDNDGGPLGWVPDPLVPYVQRVRNAGATSLRVERANGPEVGFHMRLLVHLLGTVEPGYSPFGEAGWAHARAEVPMTS